MRAVINDTVVAESDETIVVEGNHYFPPGSVNADLLTPASRTTVCSWKGTANHYDITVDGETMSNVAWYYPEPLEGAAEIKGYVAFYSQVDVTD